MFKRILPLLLVLTAVPAWAAPTYYVGTAGGAQEANFGNDLLTLGLTPGALKYFTGTTPGTSILDVAGTGVNFSSVSGIGVDGSLIAISGGTGTQLQISTPSDVYAIGLYITSGLPSTKNWAYGPSGGTVGLSNASVIFLGVISETPLAALPTITLTATQSSSGLQVTSFNIAKMASGPPPSETPEPSTFALVGTGLIALPWMARRRRRGSSRSLPSAAR